MPDPLKPTVASYVVRICFTVVTLFVAWLHKSFALDNVSVGLAVFAMAPWVLPELRSAFTSFKVAGIFEADFREIKEKVEAQQIALESGIGGGGSLAVAATAARAGSSAVHYGSALAAEDIEATTASQNGFTLSADVRPFPGSKTLYIVELNVRADATAVLSGPKVTFHLPSTFRPSDVEASFDSTRAACIERVARAAFIVRATVLNRGSQTQLQLDLADLSSALPKA